MNYLFVAGCPRSGTTAICELLNADTRMAIGLERFKFVKRNISPEYFSRERFFDLREEDTNINVPEVYEALQAKWDSGTLEFVGDKIPSLYYDMNRVWSRMPESRFIFALRDIERVASSYNRRASHDRPSWPKDKDYREAVRQWNNSLTCLQDVVNGPNREKVFMIHYESFFRPDAHDYLEALYQFLGLEITDEVEVAYKATISKSHRIKKKELDLTDEQREYLSTNKLGELEQWALSNCLPAGTPLLDLQ